MVRGSISVQLSNVIQSCYCSLRDSLQVRIIHELNIQESRRLCSFVNKQLAISNSEITLFVHIGSLIMVDY